MKRQIVEFRIKCDPDEDEEVGRLKHLAGLRKRLLDETPGYDIEQHFEEFNRRLFSGQLIEDFPKEFQTLKGVSGRVTYNAQKGGRPEHDCAMCRQGRFAGFAVAPGTLHLVMDNRYQRSESEYDGILLHEMLHVHFAQTGDLAQGHGAKFVAMAERLGHQVGLTIPIQDNLNGVPLATARLKKPTLRPDA
jgi:hypothetical protein